MNIKPIENDKEYEEYLKRADRLMVSATKDSVEEKELHKIVDIIKAYEDIHFPIKEGFYEN